MGKHTSQGREVLGRQGPVIMEGFSGHRDDARLYPAIFSLGDSSLYLPPYSGEKVREGGAPSPSAPFILQIILGTQIPMVPLLQALSRGLTSTWPCDFRQIIQPLCA